MIQVIIYGMVSGLSLVLGTLAGVFFHFRQKVIAGFMAFGSGVLIYALTFGLMEEAFSLGGFDAVIVGFLCGGSVFIAGDYLLHYLGGRKHRRRQLRHSSKDSSGAAITLGAVLDGIPESIALGLVLFTGRGKGLLMLVAVFLSNFSESISSIHGLRKEGFLKSKILGLWGLVALVCAGITVLSFLFLRNISTNTLGILEAFAAGAILAMLADTMMPEAYEEGGFNVGFVTVLGFLVAFIVSRY